jgi:hypothetical protein
MNWLKNLKKTYRAIADHIGKLLSGIGALLVSVDIAGYGDQMKQYAAQYLGDKAGQKVGVAIFVLLFARTAYAGWKLNQAKAALATATANAPALVPAPKVPEAPVAPAGGG